MNSGRFGLTTRWQHLACTIFTGVSAVDAIEGYEYLEGVSAVSVRKSVSPGAETPVWFR
jgi:hypothetical protein